MFTRFWQLFGQNGVQQIVLVSRYAAAFRNNTPIIKTPPIPASRSILFLHYTLFGSDELPILLTPIERSGWFG